MDRKRLNRSPALISLTNSQKINKINYIDTSEYLIGRSTEAHLKIVESVISRKHCTLRNVELNKWKLFADGKSVTVGDEEIKKGNSVNLHCGDNIKLSPLLVFEFKCNPNEDFQCCNDFKKPRLDTDTLPDTVPALASQSSENTSTATITSEEDKFYDVESPPLLENFTVDFLPKINDIKDSIKQYTDFVEAGSSRQSYYDEDNERNRNLVEELHFKLRFIEKLECFNDWISDTDEKDAKLLAVKLSSFFEEKSKLKDNEYMLTTNGREKDLSQILFDMDALLKKRLESVFQNVGDFLRNSPETNRLLTDISANAITKETADIGVNCELSNEIDVDVEVKDIPSSKRSALENELKKEKEEVKWHQTRIKFLEMKLTEKEKLAMELESSREENEILEGKLAELKRSLASLEIMELEHKCLLERTKHQEEDKRSKDALERHIQQQNKDILELKTEASKLVSERALLQEEIVQLIEQKNSQLQQNLNKSSNPCDKVQTSKCGVENADGEFCCGVVTAIKDSLQDLLEREFQCSICGDFFIEATVTSCSHLFCSHCLDEWKKKKKQCPFCRAPLTKEIKVGVLDDYITSFLKLVSDQLYSDRMQMIEDRRSTNKPVVPPKGRRKSRAQRNVRVIDLR